MGVCLRVWLLLPDCMLMHECECVDVCLYVHLCECMRVSACVSVVVRTDNCFQLFMPSLAEYIYIYIYICICI